MTETLPAISLVAVPGRRRQTLEIARDIERRGFAGIYMPSRWGNIAQCIGLALATERIGFGTAITPIYAQTPEEFAAAAAYLHEVSGGRFRFGIGVAHAPMHRRLGITPGKPLADTRAFVEAFRAQDGFGPLPPIVLAALRRRMVALAGEIAQGVLFANACLSHMGHSLSALPPDKRSASDFLVGNMLPVCIADDENAARALHRRRLVRYALLPNYRNYWKEAGYGDEIAAVEAALSANRHDDIARCLSDRLIADATLSGPAPKIRDGLAAWHTAGVTTPVIVPNSLNGGQLTALDEILAAFAA